jgi:hypothetical protein
VYDRHSPATDSPQQDTMLHILASPRVEACSTPQDHSREKNTLCDYERSVITLGHLFLESMYEICKSIKLVEMKWISIANPIHPSRAENKRSMFDRRGRTLVSPLTKIWLIQTLLSDNLNFRPTKWPRRRKYETIEFQNHDSCAPKDERSGTFAFIRCQQGHMDSTAAAWAFSGLSCRAAISDQE